MSSAPRCEMESTYACACTAALLYSKRLLPDSEREDCVSDLYLHLCIKVNSDDRFALRLKSSTAFVRHGARLFVIDRARELQRRQEDSLSQVVNRAGCPVSWQIADRSDHQNRALNLEAFWQQIMGFAIR